MLTRRAILSAFVACAAHARAATPAVRIAVQKTGTLAWEIDVIRRNGFDTAQGVTLEPLEFATPEAGRVALKAGAVDIAVSDWIWVSRDRALGGDMTFAPFSSTVGSLVAPPETSISRLADLRGKRIGVAGGPLNSNWLLLRAAARRIGLDLSVDATPVFGAAPLLFSQAEMKNLDAVLIFWNFAARLEAQGFKKVLSIEAATRDLGVGGPVALLGYIFSERWAKANDALVRGFLRASRQAKELLRTSDAEWRTLRPIMAAENDKIFAAYVRSYRDGIPGDSESPEDRRALYAALVDAGGSELVGPALQISPGTWFE